MPLNSNQVPIPLTDPIAVPPPPRQGTRDPFAGLQVFLTPEWEKYFTSQAQTVNGASLRVNNVALSAQGGSIGATPLDSGNLPGGLYRVTVYVRITTPAAVSSSLTVAINFIDDGVACTATLPAVTGNTTGSTGLSEFPINIDGGTPVTYTTTYASNPAGAMQYKLLIVLSAI